jgi:hypothetical protein
MAECSAKMTKIGPYSAAATIDHCHAVSSLRQNFADKRFQNSLSAHCSAHCLPGAPADCWEQPAVPHFWFDFPADRRYSVEFPDEFAHRQY